MPYSLAKEGEEPWQLLLRRGDVCRWLGLSVEEFDRTVRAGVLPFKVLRPGGARFYRKADVQALYLQGYKTGPEWNVRV
jgi:hypothetical protein